MGGQIGNELAKVGMGFMTRMAENQMQEQTRQKKLQEAYTIQSIQNLAKRGELNNVTPGVRKEAEKLLGKDIFQLAMKQNNLNQTIAQARRGAEQMVTQRQETQMQPVSPMEMPFVASTPEGEQLAAMQQTPGQVAQQASVGGMQQGISPISKPVQRTVQLSDQEVFENVQNLGAFGTYLLTGDPKAAQLAQQQAQLTFNKLQYSEAPARRLAKSVSEIRQEFSKQGRQNYIVPAEDVEKLNKSETLPQGYTAFRLGAGENSIGMVVQAPDMMNYSQKVRDQLGAMGIRDPRKATDTQIQTAVKNAFKNSDALAGASAKAKADAAEQFKLGLPVAEVARNAWATMFDRETGLHVDGNTPYGETKNKKRFTTVSKDAAKYIEDINSARASFDATMQQAQKIWGKGGLLHDVKPGIINRFAGGIKGWLAAKGQSDEEIAAFQAAAGQVAQALNRGQYAGIGVQTEQDRQYAIKVLASIADGSFFADTAKVAQKKMNELQKRMNRIQGTFLKVRDFVAPGTYHMDITKSHNELGYVKEPVDYRDEAGQQPIEQPQQAPQQPTEQVEGILSYEEVIQNDPSITRETYEAYKQQLLAGKKKVQ